MKIFYLFPNSTLRKPTRRNDGRFVGQFYDHYGMDVASNYGHETVNDFDICEKIEKGIFGRITDRFINICWSVLGGVGGSWYKVIKLRRRIANSDVVLSTADRVGLPLVLLTYARVIPRRPIIYISIGLLERLQQLRYGMPKLYRAAFKRCVNKIICYGFEEKEKLQQLLPSMASAITFIPFGVDTNYFKPTPTKASDTFILCIGADPNRDFDLLVKIANKIPSDILIVTTARRLAQLKQTWRTLPKNIRTMTDIPFPEVKTLIAQALFVVIPLKENSYSGGTTTLLQGMAMGKSVLVSQTGAIKNGYHLQNGINCFLVKPEDELELLTAMLFLIEHPERRAEVGIYARRTALMHLTWNRYVNNLFAIVSHLNTKGTTL
ncbi:glycosyltransferase family 4 protein [Candidatus Uhrbacteria bacterium]|nr:glycosyltransferase family 4 protein [Candidatus Uhrbacteria bacterium]